MAPRVRPRAGSAPLELGALSKREPEELPLTVLLPLPPPRSPIFCRNCVECVCGVRAPGRCSC